MERRNSGSQNKISKGLTMSILALTSDTLIGTPATGNLEYNGQFFGTDSNASRAQLQRIVQATAVASTSGTSIDFTSLPAWVKRITVMFNAVSTNGSSVVQVQIGSGSVTTTGYTSFSGWFGSSGQTAVSNVSTGFGIAGGNGVNARNVIMQIALQTTNTWVSSHSGGDAGLSVAYSGGGNIALGGTLDRVRITTVNGTDTFDAGSINIMYEG